MAASGSCQAGQTPRRKNREWIATALDCPRLERMEVQQMEVLRKVGGRELPRQPNEKEEQVWRRRGTLISLGVLDCWQGQPRVVCVMPYMADL